MSSRVYLQMFSERLTQVMWLAGLALGLYLNNTVASFAHPWGASCENPEIQQLQQLCISDENAAEIELADAFSAITGLAIDYSSLDSTNPNWQDYGIEASLRLLAQAVSKASLDAAALEVLTALNHWAPEYHPEHSVLIVRPVSDMQHQLQEQLLVLAPSDHPTGSYVEIWGHIDAVRYGYAFDENVLISTRSARPFSNEYKHRFQDGCWRLIGEETSEDPFLMGSPITHISINYLTGRAVTTLDTGHGDGSTYEEERMFTPTRICLGE